MGWVAAAVMLCLFAVVVWHAGRELDGMASDRDAARFDADYWVGRFKADEHRAGKAVATLRKVWASRRTAKNRESIQEDVARIYLDHASDACRQLAARDAVIAAALRTMPVTSISGTTTTLEANAVFQSVSVMPVKVVTA